MAPWLMSLRRRRRAPVFLIPPDDQRNKVTEHWKQIKTKWNSVRNGVRQSRIQDLQEVIRKFRRSDQTRAIKIIKGQGDVFFIGPHHTPFAFRRGEGVFFAETRELLWLLGHFTAVASKERHRRPNSDQLHSWPRFNAQLGLHFGFEQCATLPFLSSPFESHNSPAPTMPWLIIFNYFVFDWFWLYLIVSDCRDILGSGVFVNGEWSKLPRLRDRPWNHERFRFNQ